MANVAAFVAIGALVIVTPGPDTALTIRNTLAGGRRGGLSTAAGVALGQTTWAIATSAGLAALLLAAEPVFRALRYVGAAYLVFLGLQALAAAFRRANAGGPERTRRLPPGRALRQGLLSNLTNPKMVAFFPALLPQFASSFSGLLALGLLFATMTLGWLSAYAVVVSKAGDFLSRSRMRRALEALTAVALVSLGLRLATEDA
jgi:threonine/homoserine/homoserine lactone efflux protein